VHMLTSIVQKIQELGIQVEFIPPGCTGLLQPIDGGYNKASRQIFESSIITGSGRKIPTGQSPAQLVPIFLVGLL
jgi:hypothetical protein